MIETMVGLILPLPYSLYLNIVTSLYFTWTCKFKKVIIS